MAIQILHFQHINYTITKTLYFRNVTYIADHQRLQLCIFGSGHSLAYVLDNNVYYLDDFNEEAIQLTFDGIPGEFYNGHNDWVYEGVFQN